MNSLRIIRPLPTKGIELLPAGCLAVDGHLDYISQEETSIPEDAKYVASEIEGKKEIVLNTFDPPKMLDVIVDGKPEQVRAPNTYWHTFAGWPIPGEVIAKEEAIDVEIGRIDLP